MKKFVRLLIGVAMATALIGATAGTTPLVAPADAATYVSSTFTAPKKGQTSKNVKALQQRLVKARVLDSRYVTSYFGDVTAKAVKKFQQKHDLDATGKVNEKTWKLLVAKTGKIKVAAPKVAYPKRYETSKKVSELQARLVKAKSLKKAKVTGYFGPATTTGVKKLQKKNDLKVTGKVNAKTWGLLKKQTGKVKVPAVKVATTKVKGIAKRCKVSGRVLCVNKTTDKLYYMKSGKIIKTMDARFGCAATRTRQGTFSVLWKSRDHVSSIYHTPMPYAMFFDGGQAVHYSADFNARGYAGCSHGCVNLRDRAGIRWLFDQIKVGDRVVVYKS